MEKNKLIHKYTNKLIPLTRLLLSIKLRVLNSNALFLFLILRHFLGFIILSQNFTTNLSDVSEEVSFTNILRKLTAFGIIANSLSFKVYNVLCILAFFFFGIVLTLFLNTFYNLKYKLDYLILEPFKKRINVLNIFFHVILFFSLHYIEFLSFIYVIQFNKNESSYTLFNYLLTNPSDYFYGIIILILNTFSIVFLNVFIYVSAKFLNEPFFDTDFPLQMKYKGTSYFFFMILTNLQGIHYIELFLPNPDLLHIYKYVIFCSMCVLCIILFFRTFNNFNFSNFFNLLINFLTHFCFFSFIIELLLSLLNDKLLNAEQITFILACKILLSISFMIICHFIYNYISIRQCRSKIFKQYNGKVSEDDLECIYFFVDIVKSIKKTRIDQVEKILNIIISHKADCGLELCKCNMITDYKIQNLSSNINIILETILSNFNLGKSSPAIFLFAEYLHFLRKSSLFSYCVLNTFINKKLKSGSHLVLCNAYCLTIRRIAEYESTLVVDKEYPNYFAAFDHYKRKKLYESLINDFLDYFEQLVIFKEKFDNTMRVDQNPTKIDSYIFKGSIDPLVSNCKKYKDLYKKLKKQIRQDFSVNKCKEIELSYKLYVFFKIFNGSIPKSILNKICLDTEFDVSSSQGVQKYFNKYLDKFFASNNEALSIILEINNFFRIVYFNNKLSDALEVPLKKLIGFDIHQLIPLQLRTPHKRNLVNHYLLKKNAYLTVRTFAFTASHLLIAAKYDLAPFPNLSKNLQYIINVYPFEMDKNQYFFFISENLDLIALSGSLNTKYSISFDMLEKFNINIIKLLNLEQEMKTRFKSCFEATEISKKAKTLGGLYYLSYYLFNLNLEDEANENAKEINQDFTEAPIKISGISSNIFDSKSVTHTFQSTIKKNHLEKLVTKDTDQSGGNKTASPTADNVIQLNSYKKFTKNSRVAISDRVETKPILKLTNYVNKKSITSVSGRKSAKKSISAETLKDIHMNNLHKKKDTSEPLWNDYFSNNKNQDSTFGDTIFSVTREKKDIISFLEKLYNKSLDLEIKPELFDKLKNAIGLLKESTTKNTEEFEYYKSQNNQIITSDVFKVKVYYRKINDCPFYVVSLKEKFTLKNLKKQNPISKFRRDLTQVNENFENTDIEDSSFIDEINSKKPKYEINIIQAAATIRADDDLHRFSALEMNKSSRFKNEKDKEKKNSNSKLKHAEVPRASKSSLMLPTIEKEKVTHFNNHSHNDRVISNMKNYTKDKLMIYKKFEKNSQKKMKNREAQFSCLLWIFLLLNIIVSCIVFYLKLFSANSVQSLFHINYHSIQMINSISSLESGIISLGLMITNLTDFQNKDNEYGITSNTLQEMIDNRQKNLRDSLSNLLNEVKSSKFGVTFINNILFDTNLTYSTTMLTWDNIENKDSIQGIIDYICSSSKELALSSDLTYLSKDIFKSLLFNQFKKQEGETQNSKDSGIYYFVINNFGSLNLIIDNLSNSIMLTYEQIKSFWLKITQIIEILNVIFSIILIVVIYFILNRYDVSIFKTIILAFLNMRMGFDFKYQSEPELIKIKKQLKVFRTIVKTFTKDTIQNCDENLRKDIFDTKDHLEDMTKKAIAIDLFLSNKGKTKGDLVTLQTSENNLKPIEANLNTSNYKSTTNQLVNTSTTLNNSSMAFLNGAKQTTSQFVPIKKKDTDSSLNNSNDKKYHKNTTEKDTTPTEGDQIISNGQILKHTTHYPINLIRIAKILIAVIFFVYILFVLASLIANNAYLNGLDTQYGLVNTLAVKIPSITKYFNLIRLSIIENDMSFQDNYLDVLRNYTAGDVLFNTIINDYKNDLVDTSAFEDTLNKEIKNINIDDICIEPIQAPYCRHILQDDKGFNKKGIRLAAKSVIQSLSNIFKDYNSLQSEDSNNLSSTDIITKYFKTSDFININLDIEFILNSAEYGYLNLIDSDMNSNFSNLIKVNLIFGSISIVLNLLIIFYVIFGFFNKIKFIMDYILYTTKKFNKVMYD